MLNWMKLLFFVCFSFSFYGSVLVTVCSGAAAAEHSLADYALIYFTYTCSDIHIISCRNILTPDAQWFIQVIHTNLHSYHERMGRYLWSGVWPKKAHTQAKTQVGWIKSVLSVSFSLSLSMDSFVCSCSDFTGSWTLVLCNLFMSDWYSQVSPAVLRSSSTLEGINW